IVAAHDFIAGAAISINASDIWKEYPRFAWYVRAHVPGTRQRVYRHVGAVVDVAPPTSLRQRRRLDRVPLPVAHAGEAVTHPVDMLFDRHRHVRQDRRTSGAGYGEEVRKARRRQTQVRLGPPGPLFTKRQPVAPFDVDGDDGTGHRVEPDGEHDGV